MKWILCLIFVSGVAFGQNNNTNVNVNTNGNDNYVKLDPITITNENLGECYEDCASDLLTYMDNDDDDTVVFVDLKCRKYCNLPSKPLPNDPKCRNDMCVDWGKNVNKNTNTNTNSSH